MHGPIPFSYSLAEMLPLPPFSFLFSLLYTRHTDPDSHSPREDEQKKRLMKGPSLPFLPESAFWGPQRATLNFAKKERDKSQSPFFFSQRHQLHFAPSQLLFTKLGRSPLFFVSLLLLLLQAGVKGIYAIPHFHFSALPRR